MTTTEEQLMKKIEEGMTKGSEVDVEHKKHADKHEDGNHMDMSYLDNDDEKHLDVD